MPAQQPGQEFSHAVTYVNRIKARFSSQPEVYKKFLEILHAYQKQQKAILDMGGAYADRILSETQVYQQVSRATEI